MSLSKLSKLPPEVLSSVLNNRAIPLSRRLRLRLLCNRWANIIEDGLKKETSLVVCDTEDYHRIREPDDLVIQSSDLTDGFTLPLSHLFTSLTQLTIDFGGDASWNKLPCLLAFLDTNNLTTVKLRGFNYKDYQMGAIAAFLACLPALASLTLVGYRFINHLLLYLGPVLPRLEAFGCYDESGDSSGIISSSLSSRCTHLWLTSDDFQSFNRQFLVELSRHLTHLHLLNCGATIWQSISQMGALSSLTLRFIDYNLDESFFSHLTPFTGLTQVKFFGFFYSFPLALPSKKETPLSTVKRLSLEVDFGNSPVDYQAFCQAISAWFPNLVKLTVLVFPSIIPDIRASLGKLPFSLEIGDRDSVDYFAPDW